MHFNAYAPVLSKYINKGTFVMATDPNPDNGFTDTSLENLAEKYSMIKHLFYDLFNGCMMAIQASCVSVILSSKCFPPFRFNTKSDTLQSTATHSSTKPD